MLSTVWRLQWLLYRIHPLKGVRTRLQILNGKQANFVMMSSRAGSKGSRLLSGALRIFVYGKVDPMRRKILWEFGSAHRKVTLQERLWCILLQLRADLA